MNCIVHKSMLSCILKGKVFSSSKIFHYWYFGEPCLWSEPQMRVIGGTEETVSFLGNFGLKWLGCTECHSMDTTFFFFYLMRLTGGEGGRPLPCSPTPFGGFWNWELFQMILLDGGKHSLSRIFQFPSSFNGNYKQAFKFPSGHSYLKTLKDIIQRHPL